MHLVVPNTHAVDHGLAPEPADLDEILQRGLAVCVSESVIARC